MKEIGLKGLLIQNKHRLTKPEKIVYSSLKRLGIKFKSQHLMYKKFLIDAWIPKLNIVLNINGRYWHNLPKQQKIDKAKKAYLVKCGHIVLDIWDDEFTQNTIDNKLWSLLKGGEN